MKFPVTEITVGARVRKDIDAGIGELCASIQRVGQLQPILVDADFNLIAGARRRRACELLGIQVEIFIVKTLSETLDRLLAERDENTCRRDFTPSEAVEIGRQIEAIEAPRAAERMKAGQPSSESDEGRTDERVAAAVGMGKDKYRAAKSVVESGSPELIEAMDSGDLSVNAAAAVLKMPTEQQAEAVQAAKEKRPKVVHNSGQTEWFTPSEYIEAARRTMGDIDCDPASCSAANGIVNARQFYTRDDDGRSKPWGKTVWLNPPYGQPACSEFCGALADKHRRGEVEQAVVLVNNSTETQWFSELVDVATAVVFPEGRVKFLDAQCNPRGTPLQGQAILYVGGNPDRFLEHFGGFGWGAKSLVAGNGGAK